MEPVRNNTTIQITTTTVTVNSPSVSGRHSPPRHPHTLHTPTGMPERDRASGSGTKGESSGTKGESSFRPIRQPFREQFHASAFATPSGRLNSPLPETVGASPEHDSAHLIPGGSNSHRVESLQLSLDSPFISPEFDAASFRIEEAQMEASTGGFRWSLPMPTFGRVRPQSAPTEGQPQPTFNAPRPASSYAAVGAALLAGMKQAMDFVGGQVALTASTVTLPFSNFKSRLMGALAGHAVHQIVSVGIPTFVREAAAVAIMHRLRHASMSEVVTLQVGVGGANLLIQLGREYRENRNINQAARAYFSLSKDEWAARSPVARNEMRTHMRKMSRMITNMQVMASVTNGLLMMNAFNQKDQLGTLKPVATEIKVGIYAAMRDGLQASFTMVKLAQAPNLPDGTPVPFAAGMHGAAHGAAAATYAGANFAAAFLSDALMGALVPGKDAAVATLISTSTQSHGAMVEAVKITAMAASVSAATNTLAEVTDWFQRMQHFVNMTPGATQSWGPAYPDKLAKMDYGRLLDQAPARAAAFNAIFSTLGVMGLALSHTNIPGGVQQFMGNATVGIMIGMLDSPIMGIWQAEEAVRNEPNPTPSPPPSTVTITEIVEPTGGDIETGTLQVLEPIIEQEIEQVGETEIPPVFDEEIQQVGESEIHEVHEPILEPYVYGPEIHQGGESEIQEVHESEIQEVIEPVIRPPSNNGSDPSSGEHSGGTNQSSGSHTSAEIPVRQNNNNTTPTQSRPTSP
jgi:hypothetical protein